MTNGVSRVEEFIWRKIGDETVVIRDDGLSMHVLNKTAAHIWELCDGTKSPDEIAASLCERFEVELEEATADVCAALEKMEKEGLVRSAVEVAEG